MNQMNLYASIEEEIYHMEMVDADATVPQLQVDDHEPIYVNYLDLVYHPNQEPFNTNNIDFDYTVYNRTFDIDYEDMARSIAVGLPPR